jgi:predicted ferric reductase
MTDLASRPTMTEPPVAPPLDGDGSAVAMAGPRTGLTGSLPSPVALGPDAAAAQPLAEPEPGRLLVSDVAVALIVFLALVVGTWARHGGVVALSEGGVARWTSLSQLTGLLATASGLVGLVLVARPRVLERRYGLDRLFVWHKWLGGTLAVLVGAHVVASVVAWSDGVGWWPALRELTGGQPYMAGATVGALLLATVALTSMKPARRRLSYETWYLIHLTAYLALALSFAHQVVLGGDFADDPVAWWFWVGAHLGVLVLVVAGRWGRLLVAYLRPLRIAEVRTVAPGTVEVRLAGRRLRSMRGDAGQFAVLRPLVPRLWWQGHPYSLSAPPSTHGLVFTIKDRGDASAALCELPAGTRVAVEGPYGALTPAALDPDRSLLLVVGGIGVAPARALLARLPRSGLGRAPVLVYRARHPRDLVHVDELRALVEGRGGRLLTILGRRELLPVREPFSAESLRHVVPDVGDRQAFVCGPEDLCAAARRGLRRAGVPAARIHYDRTWW